jgi:hypothetical protein
MREKIQDIIEDNYGRFIGTNEAALNASVELEELANKHALDFITWVGSITWIDNMGCYKNDSHGTKDDRYDGFKLKTKKELLEIYNKQCNK